MLAEANIRAFVLLTCPVLVRDGILLPGRELVMKLVAMRFALPIMCAVGRSKFSVESLSSLS